MRSLGLFTLLTAAFAGVQAENSAWIGYYSDRAEVSLSYNNIPKDAGVCDGLLNQIGGNCKAKINWKCSIDDDGYLQMDFQSSRYCGCQRIKDGWYFATNNDYGPLNDCGGQDYD